MATAGTSREHKNKKKLSRFLERCSIAVEKEEEKEEEEEGESERWIASWKA